MTRKEELLRSVLDNPGLQTFGHYDSLDYETYDDALESDNAIVYNVSRLINGDFGEITTDADKKKVYQTISTDLQTNLIPE